MEVGKIALLTVLALGVSGFFCDDAYARRGGGFSSSSSRSSSSRSSGWGSSSRRSSPSRTTKWGSSNRSSSSAGRSAADQKLYDKAKASGTAYSTKSAATADFKSKYSRQYTSRYASKPPIRPAHIPQTTTVGGSTYDISYNQRYRGYGYMRTNRSWVMYDAMEDAVMLDILMSRNHYYYDRRYYGRHDNLAGHLQFGLVCTAIICAGAVYVYVTL